jgi:nuclear pore complex protein Nup205
VAAHLLEAVLKRSERNDMSELPVAVADFHRESSFSLEVIALMLQAVEDTKYSLEIRNFLRRQLQAMCDEIKKSGSTFCKRITSAVSSLSSKLVNLIEKGVEPDCPAQPRFGINSSALSDSIQAIEIQSFITQRKVLVEILYLSAKTGLLNGNDIVELLESLSKIKQLDATASKMVVCVIASLSYPQGDVRSQRSLGYLKESDFLTKATNIIRNKTWASSELCGLITLQWTLLLSIAYQHGDLSKVGDDQLETLAEKAIYNGAFKFIIAHLLDHVDVIHPENMALDSITTEQKLNDFENKYKDVMDSDFAEHRNHEIESLVKNLIHNMSGVIRKMKNRDEDIPTKFQSQYGVREDLSKQTMGLPGRRDLESLFTLIANLYQNRPDAGIDFWALKEHRLFSFLKWGSDAVAHTTVQAYLDMLASLATGKACAEHAHDFMSATAVSNYNRSGPVNYSLCSWTALFRTLDEYAKHLNPSNSTYLDSSSRPNYQRLDISPKEVDLLKCFLKLLRNVITHSPSARRQIFEDPKYHAVQTLFSLVSSSVSNDFKGSIFGVLQAFAIYSRETPTVYRDIWGYVESYQLISTQQKLDFLSQNPSSQPQIMQVDTTTNSGVTHELEHIETSQERYPETVSFLKLLNTLLRSYQFSKEVRDPSFLPNFVKYVAFVMDRIFVKARVRGYVFPHEKWEILEESCKLFWRCLDLYDIDTFFSEPSPDNYNVKAIDLVGKECYTHPGFRVLIKILCGSNVFEEMVHIIQQGVTLVNETPIANVTNTFHYLFKIILRVLDVQSLFLDKLVPILLQHQLVDIPSSLASLEKLFSFQHDAIIQIALFITCTKSDELCRGSVTILKKLSVSSLFLSLDNGTSNNCNRFVSLFLSSPYLSNIIQGYIERLGLSEVERYNIEQTSMLEEDGDVSNAHLKDSVSLSILDFLLSNLETCTSFPSISHVLLGLDMVNQSGFGQRSDSLMDITAHGCLHTILEFLQLPDETSSDYLQPFAFGYPRIAEKALHLVYLLASKEPTALSILRLLRSQDDLIYGYIIKVLNNFSILEEVNNAFQSESHTLQSISGEQMDIFLSILYQKEWILKLLALELRVASKTGQGDKIEKLLRPLYVNSVADWGSDDNPFYNDPFSPQAKVFDQSHCIATDLLNQLTALNRSPAETFSADAMEMARAIDISQIKQHDENGCMIYDLRVMHQKLDEFQRRLEVQGNISTQGLKTKLSSGIAETLRCSLYDNQLTQKRHAIMRVLQAWKGVLVISVVQCYESVPREINDNFLIDWISLLLSAAQQEECDLQASEYYSEIVLLFTVKLSQNMDISQPNQLPISSENLMNLIRLLVVTITTKDTTIRLRGNYYCILSELLQLRKKPSLSATTGQSDETGYKQDSLILDSIKSYSERFMDILVRDCIDRNDIFKIVSLCTLTAFYDVSNVEKQNKLLSYLIGKNYLRQLLLLAQGSNAELKGHLETDSGMVN